MGTMLTTTVQLHSRYLRRKVHNAITTETHIRYIFLATRIIIIIIVIGIGEGIIATANASITTFSTVTFYIAGKVGLLCGCGFSPCSITKFTKSPLRYIVNLAFTLSTHKGESTQFSTTNALLSCHFFGQQTHKVIIRTKKNPSNEAALDISPVLWSSQQSARSGISTNNKLKLLKHNFVLV